MVPLTAFDPLVRSRSLLTHFFYAQKWNKGELTPDNLRTYAKEYFYLVKRIPGIVARVRDRAIERGYDDAGSIERNILEEQEHVELWKRFGHSLGLSDQEIGSHEPSPTVREAVSELEALAEGSFEDGVACMYALELDLPEIACSKKEGLCKFYGLNEDNKDAHVYFDEHLGEEAHLQVWRRVSIEPLRARNVIARSLAAQHKILDGVCDACGLAMVC